MYPHKTCMEIFHSDVGQQIWTKKGRSKQRTTIDYDHPVVIDVTKLVDDYLEDEGDS